MQIQDPEPEMDLSDRIENCWKNFIHIKGRDIGQKYPIVSMVVKACFILSNENADVERGFSKCGCILIENNTAKSLKMLNARLFVYDGK